ncbi:hypothetical protein R1T16_06330 [Flavobacterium sp. DG1-102-2]|uniref:hypothetical protein n=1 Tax=Flavobacterium sp. DG1-102-2 TaxID=3081663 RepID=UPI002948E7D8|nr:hypothetical protein [Flavobacterium sp. DG1-102-2]MDV6168034.1 hypothetical protein [Flavobacterium sp. DG1-102-2]
MKKSLLTALILVPVIALCSCTGKMKEMQEQANQQFGDQHFKTTISLIELYKVRHGDYPSSLDSLDFIGDWDKIAISSTAYKKLDNGYELNLTNGWIGKPDSMKFPPDFWKGLGLKKSNLKAFKEDAKTDRSVRTAK